MTTKPKTRKAPAASAPKDVKLTAYMANYLHCPARESQLESLEEHLTKAARLSRALWELVGSDGFPTEDKRSAYAVIELASAVADHASAAEFIFNTSE
ncbi:MAG: hypothetical protein H0U99_07420 [Chthoniobacterales bacterium]|nr:hypothetical protein [Chthoniobacterales bacterium]